MKSVPGAAPFLLHRLPVLLLRLAHHPRMDLRQGTPALSDTTSGSWLIVVYRCRPPMGFSQEIIIWPRQPRLMPSRPGVLDCSKGFNEALADRKSIRGPKIPKCTCASCPSAQVSDSDATAASRPHDGGAGRGPQGLVSPGGAERCCRCGTLGATGTPSCASSRCAARSTSTAGGLSVVAAWQLHR